MSKPIDELVIQIRADTKKLQKDLDQIKGKLNTTGAVGGAAFGAVGGASGALAGSLKKLAGPAAIGAVLLGIKELGTFAARSGMEFEDLKDSLDTVFGSVEAGDKQFDRILRFSQTTPFQIDTVTKAFIGLGSVGIEPTTRMMQTFADAASVAVDQQGAFEAMIRVVQRAEAGALGLVELNMLADRGIDVFKGLKEELGLSRMELTAFGQTTGGAQVIVEGLVNVLEKQFGGAMVAKMDNLSVSVSNMGIAFKTLGNEVFESGLGLMLKGFVNTTTDLINRLSIVIAKARGAGIGIQLETPNITTDMDFDEMQDERAKVARANIKKIREEQDVLRKLTEEQRTFFDDAMHKFVESKSINMAGQVGKQLIKMFTDTGLSADEAEALVLNLNKALADESNALIQASKSQKQLTKEEKEAFLNESKRIQVFGMLEKAILDNKGTTDLFSNAQTQLTEIFKENSDFLTANGIPNQEALGVALNDLGIELNDTTKDVKELTVEEQKLVDAFSFVRSKVASTISETDKYTFANENLAVILEKNKDELAVLGITSLPQLRKALTDSKNDTDELTVAQQKMKDGFSFVSSKIASLIKETDQYAFANENLQEIFEENKQAFEVLGIETLPQLQQALADTKDATEDVKDVLGDELKQAVINTSNSFTTDFVNSLLDGQNGLESFKSFARSMVSQIIAIFMQLAVVNKIINSIFNLTGDDALNTIDILPRGGKTPSVSTGGGMGMKAGGGTIQGGTPTLVGERGAEIFVPNTGGTIMNNMNTKNAMGGGSPVNIYQTISFATGIVPTVRAEVTKMMPQIADVTKAAVQESAMRGGNFRRSLVGG